MEFQKLAKELNRMCRQFHECAACPLDKINPDKYCHDLCFDHPAKVEQIISDWSKEHPIVTNGDKLKEVFDETFSDKMFILRSCTANQINVRFEEKWWNAEYKEPEVDNDAD